MGVQGHLDLLMRHVRSTADTVLETRVEKALAATQSLRAILDGILDVRLLEEQRLPLSLGPTPVRALLEDAIGTLEGAGAAKEVGLGLRIDGEPVAVLDRRFVTRAIENLLSNAIRHSDRGTEVEVVAIESGDRITIEVADRGEGISDALKDRVFQKFGGVAGAQSGGRRGYGLGLFLVRLVAEAHGGSVAVRDREGGGTVFALVLPK